MNRMKRRTQFFCHFIGWEATSTTAHFAYMFSLLSLRHSYFKQTALYSMFNICDKPPKFMSHSIEDDAMRRIRLVTIRKGKGIWFISKILTVLQISIWKRQKLLFQLQVMSLSASVWVKVIIVFNDRTLGCPFCFCTLTFFVCNSFYSIWEIKLCRNT